MGEIPQAALTQIDQIDALPHQSRGRCAAQHLTTVPRRHHAVRPVQNRGMTVAADR
jgi:hypothetical protein